MGASSTHESPTGVLAAQPGLGASTSQCQNCGSTLASDQRYCLHCGERRGKARFTIGGAPPEPVTTVTREPVAPRPSRISSGMVFISFVGTLLLAMGVGVLIGHTNNSQPVQRASNPNINVSVGGGGGGGGSSTAASNSSGSGAQQKVAKSTVKPLPKKVIVKAAAAAANVLGGKNLPPPTVTVGQKGKGAGFQNGHFTGNFFGGG